MGHIVVLAKRTGMSRVDLVSASHSLAAMRKPFSLVTLSHWCLKGGVSSEPRRSGMQKY